MTGVLLPLRRNFSHFQQFEKGLGGWWDMTFFDHPFWFIIGVLIAIALFATVSALTIQNAFGQNLASVLVGPAIAVIAVLIFYRLQGRVA